MKALHPVQGHIDARRTLARAVAAGELPGAMLLYGPPGIGKQRMALWVAQLLLCSRRTDEPCGTCHACHLCLHLEHPDLHWFFPVPRPRSSGGADRLGEALEETRATELAARRDEPLYSAMREESVGLFLAHVQVLRRLAQTRPAMGPAKVFIVGDAEALVPQEASQEAANALLKLLEEPPADTTVILTAADPDSLLATIRSRLLPVRLRPLPSDDVAEFLSTARGLDPGSARVPAALSGGSIGRALAFLPDGPLEDLRQSARAMLEAALARDPAARLAAAVGQAPAGARASAYLGTLDFLATWLRDLAAVDTGAEEVVVNTDSLSWIRARVRDRPGVAAGISGALHAVEEAASLSTLNLNPQLTTAWLLKEISRELSRAVRVA